MLAASRIGPDFTDLTPALWNIAPGLFSSLGFCRVHRGRECDGQLQTDCGHVSHSNGQ